jgi:hypothetical protein
VKGSGSGAWQHNPGYLPRKGKLLTLYSQDADKNGLKCDSQMSWPGRSIRHLVNKG